MGVGTLPDDCSTTHTVKKMSRDGATLEQSREQTQTRQYPRFRLRLPVLCESPAVPGYRTFGLTKNVSQGGLLLEVPRPLAAGTWVSLLLIAGNQSARAEAVVVWLAENTPGRMGLQFTEWAGTDSLIWGRLLAFQAGPTPRASLRISIDLEVTCRMPPDTCLPGRAQNLSDTGMMIVLPQTVPPQTRLSVAVPPWLILSPVEAEMEVIWTRDAPHGDGAIHGLYFLADDVGKELFLIGTLLRHLLA